MLLLAVANVFELLSASCDLRQPLEGRRVVSQVGGPLPCHIPVLVYDIQQLPAVRSATVARPILINLLNSWSGQVLY